MNKSSTARDDVIWSPEYGLDPADEEAIRNEQLEFLKKHEGHGSQHSLMLIIIIGVLLAFQVVLVLWRKNSPRTYNLCTLIGLWLIPPFMFLARPERWSFTRFLSVWTVFTIMNGWILFAATRRPLNHRTPRIVYSWFYRLYQVCYASGILGYAMILLEMFGMTQILFKDTDPAARSWFSFGFYCLVYGLYFGVMGRDLAQLLADYMASTIGYYSKDGLPKKHLRDHVCAVCGDDLTSLEQDDDRTIYQLECRHRFHEGCIRGWCLVGKKDVCPYCKEKVDLKQFRRQIWDAQTDLYMQLLDGVRYLVAWQPLILGVAKLTIKILGLE